MEPATSLVDPPVRLTHRRRAIQCATRWTGLGLLLVGTAAAAATPDPAESTRLVESLHAAMLGVMQQADALGYAGRRDRLQPAIDARYDFSFIAEKSVGRAWRGMDDEQKTRLVDAIRRLAGATYAARMSGFDGEVFETLGTEPASQDTLLVRTRIVQADGEAIPIDYRLRSTPEGPRIVDVFYDGTVSELAMRRSEYSSLLKKGGLPELLRALEEKIGEQARARPT